MSKIEVANLLYMLAF